jgi:hypothetical protein
MPSLRISKGLNLCSSHVLLKMRVASEIQLPRMALEHVPETLMLRLDKCSNNLIGFHRHTKIKLDPFWEQCDYPDTGRELVALTEAFWLSDRTDCHLGAETRRFAYGVSARRRCDRRDRGRLKREIKKPFQS